MNEPKANPCPWSSAIHPASLRNSSVVIGYYPPYIEPNPKLSTGKIHQTGIWAYSAPKQGVGVWDGSTRFPGDDSRHRNRNFVPQLGTLQHLLHLAARNGKLGDVPSCRWVFHLEHSAIAETEVTPIS
jgi:hypothetical protein